MQKFEQDLQDEELDFLLMDKEGGQPDSGDSSTEPGSSEERRDSSGELKPTLHGDLTQVNLPDIFQSLVMSQMEGTLQVNSKWKVTYVHHEAGKLRILLPEEDWLKRIGYRLLSSGLVDGRDLKAALRQSHKEQVDLGQILVADYGADSEQIRAIRAALEEDAIFELFTQNRGNFAFYGDAYPDLDLERRFGTCPTFEASQILLEVARRSDEWVEILREIEDINEIMRPTEEAYRPESEVDEVEENLLSHLDGTRSLSDIAGGMLYCLFDVMKAAQTLKRRGFIELVPTEDLFALTQADIHAEQEKRALYYLNLVSTLRRPLPLDQLQDLADLQMRVSRPRDAGKTYADCASLVDDEDARLHYLYQSKRLDPRNPETLARLLDALAIQLTRFAEEGTIEDESGEGEPAPGDGESEGEGEDRPESAADGAVTEASDKPREPGYKHRSKAHKREDFLEFSLELAEFLQHRDEAQEALRVVDRLLSHGFEELKIAVLKSKILCRLDEHDKAIQVLVEVATSYRKEGKRKELTHCLEQVLKLDPGNTKARNELRDLRSRFNRRVRRLLLAALLSVIGGLGAWKYYESMALADRTQAMIDEAEQKSRSNDAQQMAQALGILAEVRRIAGDTQLGGRARELTDQILAERARRKQALIDAKEKEFDSLAEAARTSFLQGNFTKAAHLYMAMATSKRHGKRRKFIRELFLSQQDNLATELENEFSKFSIQDLPDVSNLRNREEYKAALIDMGKRFPMERRRRLRSFVEAIRLGIVERHPFLAKKGTEPIPTLSTTLFGHDKVPERYESIQRILAGDDGLPEDLTARIRAMDQAELDRLAAEARKGGLFSGLGLMQEAGILASPAKTLYLDLQDYLHKLQSILELDTSLIEEAKIHKRLAQALDAPPFSVNERLEAIDREIGDLVARNKKLRMRRQDRIKALGKALVISNDRKVSAEERRKGLRSLGLAYAPQVTAKVRTERAERFLDQMLSILSKDQGSYRLRMESLRGVQRSRDWRALEQEEQETSDAELLALLSDEASERPVRTQRTKFAILVARIHSGEEILQAEVEERQTTLQTFQTLLETLSRDSVSLEDKLAACKKFQLQIEVLLLRDGGKIQEIEEARRIGNAGLLGRYMHLLGRVEQIETLLEGKLSTNSSIRIINGYFLEAEKAFKEHRFEASLENYKKLLVGYRKLNPEDRDAVLLAQFEQEEIKLRDICEQLAEIDAARKRNDHQTALDHYRYLDRYYPDVNFKQIVRLPILVSSVPPGAQVFVNGESRGLTPKTLAAPADTELRIEIRMQGFKTVTFDARTSEASRFVRDLEIRESWTWNCGAAITTEPTVDRKNKRILLSDRRGKLHSLDLETGEVAYTKSFKSLSGEFDRIRIYGDRFLLASAEGVLRRFETRTGKEVAPAQNLDKSLLLPSPMLGKDILMTSQEGELMILDPANDAPPRSLLQLTDLRLPPQTDGQNFIVAATTDGKVRAWDKQGRLLWEQSSKVEGCGWTALALHGDRVFVPTDRRKLHCLDSRSGRILWTTQLEDDLTFPPAADTAKVYLATTGRELVVLDRNTGEVMVEQRHKLSDRPSGPIARWRRFAIIPIRGAGLRFFDVKANQMSFRLGGKATSEVPCAVLDDFLLFYSTKGDIRSYPKAPILGLSLARPGK